MNLRSVDLNLLTVFDAVIREGNLTRAAANVGMSQPAMSDAVARLRHLLKDDLFIRTGHGVRPTPRAREYAAPIRRILDLVMMTLSEAQSFDHLTSSRRFNLVLREYGELEIERGPQHAHLDVDPLAGAPALQKRRQDSHRQKGRAVLIDDVAYASGFSSLRRFNALFKERYRLEPRRCVGQEDLRSGQIGAAAHSSDPTMEARWDSGLPWRWW